MLGSSRFIRAAQVVLLGVVCVLLLPGVGFSGSGTDLYPNSISKRNFDIPGSKHATHCRQVREQVGPSGPVSIVMRDFQGNPMLQGANSDELVVVVNKRIGIKGRTGCLNDLGKPTGIKIQGIESLTTPQGDQYYSWGWGPDWTTKHGKCLKRSGPNRKCVKWQIKRVEAIGGTDTQSQSGGIRSEDLAGGAAQKRALIARPEAHAMGCRQSTCNGQAAGDIVESGINYTDGSHSSPFVYQVQPVCLPDEGLGFYGPGDPQWRPVADYGCPNRRSSAYTNLVWSLFDVKGGGLTRTHVPRGAYFHRSAVDAMLLPTYQGKRGDVRPAHPVANGSVLFYYGYAIADSPPKHRIYGWILAGHSLTGPPGVPVQYFPHVESEEVSLSSPSGSDNAPSSPFSAYADEGLGDIHPEDQILADLQDEDLSPNPDTPQIFSCSSCNQFGEGIGSDGGSQLTGDVNGDGLDDAIAIDADTGDWNVALNKDGRLAAPMTWASDFGADRDNEFVADVDGDGRADAITFTASSGEWDVRRSTGHGFAAAEVWETGFGNDSNFQLLADVTGDGHVDAVVIDNDTGKWWVARAMHGQFSSSHQQWANDLGVDAETRLLADVNGDGKADAIFVDGESGDWKVAVSTGSVFGSASVWAEAFYPDADIYDVADVTGDGKADAVAFDASSQSWQVGISTGTGFGAATQWIAGFGSESTTNLLADVNGDGKSDAIAADFEFGSWLAVESTGSGFSGYGAWSPGVGDESKTQLAGDVDGDGKADAIAVMPDGSWSVALSNGFGYGSDSVWLSELGDADGTQLVGDVDGDGKVDAVNVSSSGDWTVALSSGSNFDSGESWKSGFGAGAKAVFLADVDADGKADAVAVSSSGVWSVALSSGTGFGTSSTWRSDFGSTATSLFLSDVNGDGKSDAVSFDASTGEWQAAIAGTATFGSEITMSENFAMSGDVPLMADVNGDGKSDAVAFRPGSANWYVAESNGSAFHAPERLMSMSGSGSHTQLLADVNGDGNADSIAYYDATEEWYVNPDLTQDLTDDNSSLDAFDTPASWMNSSTDASTDAPLLGDVDGDGKDDAVTVDPTDGTVRAAISSGSASPDGFGGGSYVTWATGVDTSAASTFLADMNGDGKDDLITVQPSHWDPYEFAFTNVWQVWLSDGGQFNFDTGDFDGANNLSDYSTKSLAADVNGDGKADAISIGSGGAAWVATSTGSGLNSRQLFFDDSEHAEFDIGLNALVGDVNGDGKTDLVSISRDSEFGPESTWKAALSNGSEFVAETDPFATAFGRGADALSLADVTGDGKADPIAYFAGDGRWEVHPSDLDSTDPGETWRTGFGGSTDSALIGDVTGDALADAVTYEHVESSGAIWSVAPAVPGEPTTRFTAGPPDESEITDAETSWEFDSDIGATSECRIDDESWESCTSPFAPTGIGDGSHTVSVRATSSLGELETSPPQLSFTIDSSAPDTEIDSGPTGGTTITSGRADFEFASSEDHVTYFCEVDGADAEPCASTYSTDPLDDGSHTLSVAAQDRAGNRDSSPAAATFVVDGTSSAPNTTISSAPSGVSGDGTPTFEFSGSSGTDAYQCQVNDDEWADCTSPETIKLQAGIDDDQSFAVRAIADGVPDPSPASASWHADLLPPTIDIAAPDPSDDFESGDFTVEFSSSESLDGTTCAIDENEAVACDTEDVLSTDSSGFHSLTVSGIDAAGNAGTAVTYFNVSSDLDTELDPASGAISSDAGPEFEFDSATVGATYQCQVDDGSWATCASPYVV
ncbi:MAG: FG-GAP repeat domain-containing protein, partial [Solirubrobacterales bacterium]